MAITQAASRAASRDQSEALAELDDMSSKEIIVTPMDAPPLEDHSVQVIQPECNADPRIDRPARSYRQNWMTDYEKSYAVSRELTRSRRMPSPFPGMDPYLEAQGHWESFHAALVLHSAKALNEELPRSYVAKVETRIAVLVSFDEPSSERVPDVLLARGERPAHTRAKRPAGLATLEPVTIHLAKREVEVRERAGSRF